MYGPLLLGIMKPAAQLQIVLVLPALVELLHCLSGTTTTVNQDLMVAPPTHGTPATPCGMGRVATLDVLVLPVLVDLLRGSLGTTTTVNQELMAIRPTSGTPATPCGMGVATLDRVVVATATCHGS